MVHQAHEALRKSGLDGHVDVRVMDSEHLEFAADSFDVVLCSFGVAFFPRPERAAEEFVRVVGPSGLVGVSSWVDEDERWNWEDELLAGLDVPRRAVAQAFDQPRDLNGSLLTPDSTRSTRTWSTMRSCSPPRTNGGSGSGPTAFGAYSSRSTMRPATPTAQRRSTRCSRSANGEAFPCASPLLRVRPQVQLTCRRPMASSCHVCCAVARSDTGSADTIDPFGPPEHLEPALRTDVTPGQVEEASPRPPCTTGPRKSRPPAGNDLDVDLPRAPRARPPGRAGPARGVPGARRARCPCRAVRTAERPTRQVHPGDRHVHAVHDAPRVSPTRFRTAATPARWPSSVCRPGCASDEDGRCGSAARRPRSSRKRSPSTSSSKTPSITSTSSSPGCSMARCAAVGPGLDLGHRAGHEEASVGAGDAGQVDALVRGEDRPAGVGRDERHRPVLGLVLVDEVRRPAGSARRPS